MIVFLTIINKFLVFHSLVLAFVTKLGHCHSKERSMHLFLANYWSFRKQPFCLTNTSKKLGHEYCYRIVPPSTDQTQSRPRSTNQSSKIFHEENYAKWFIKESITLHHSYESCFETRHEWKYDTTTDSERFPFGWRMLDARSRVARKHLAAFY